MEYTNLGKITAKKIGTDFYIVESYFGEYHILESMNELELGDIISWDITESFFYNKNDSIVINAIFQWKDLTYSQAKNILANL